MGLRTRIAALGVVGLPVVILWLFGGIIGAIIGIARDELLYAVCSLVLPMFGAIYTIVAFFQWIF